MVALKALHKGPKWDSGRGGNLWIREKEFCLSTVKGSKVKADLALAARALRRGALKKQRHLSQKNLMIRACSPIAYLSAHLWFVQVFSM